MGLALKGDHDQTANADRAPVDGIIDLLTAHEPDALGRLRRVYPDQVELLRSGKVMGPGAAATGGVYLDLAGAGLRALEARVQVLLNQVPRKLKLARRLKLWSVLISAITSVGLIGILNLLEQPLLAASIVAGVNVASSILGLLGQHLETPMASRKLGLVELLEEAIRMEGAVSDLNLKLKAAKEKESVGSARLAREVNALSTKIRRIEIFSR